MYTEEVFVQWIVVASVHPSGQGSEILTYYVEINPKGNRTLRLKKQEAIKLQCKRTPVDLRTHQFALCRVGTFPRGLPTSPSWNMVLKNPLLSKWMDRSQCSQPFSTRFHFLCPSSHLSFNLFDTFFLMLPSAERGSKRSQGLQVSSVLRPGQLCPQLGHLCWGERGIILPTCTERWVSKPQVQTLINIFGMRSAATDYATMLLPKREKNNTWPCPHNDWEFYFL